MEPNVFDKVHEVDLKKTMEQSYIDYAMSVISARALPDILWWTGTETLVLWTVTALRPCVTLRPA